MERSAGAENTLLYAPDRAADTEATIAQTLSTHAEPNLLVVSYHEGPDAWLGAFHTHTQTSPADLGFVDVGGTTRSVAVASSATGPTATQEASAPAVTAVNDPTDLTELGIKISQYLEQWTDTTRPIVIYLDSLTALLDAVELNRAYRFLHVLTGRTASVDAHAYYRLNPDSVEAQTVAVVRDLMDDRIELAQGSPTDDRVPQR